MLCPIFSLCMYNIYIYNIIGYERVSLSLLLLILNSYINLYILHFRISFVPPRRRLLLDGWAGGAVHYML